MRRFLLSAPIFLQELVSLYHQEKVRCFFFSGTTNVDTISFIDKVFYGYYHVKYRAEFSLLCSDIPSYASAQTCRTGNKSDYGVRGVMFNNKKYYLPRSMCVAIAIKYNEWKVLEACSKF